MLRRTRPNRAYKQTSRDRRTRVGGLVRWAAHVALPDEANAPRVSVAPTDSALGRCKGDRMSKSHNRADGKNTDDTSNAKDANNTKDSIEAYEVAMGLLCEFPILPTMGLIAGECMFPIQMVSAVTGIPKRTLMRLGKLKLLRFFDGERVYGNDLLDLLGVRWSLPGDTAESYIDRCNRARTVRDPHEVTWLVEDQMARDAEPLVEG